MLYFDKKKFRTSCDALGGELYNDTAGQGCASVVLLTFASTLTDYSEENDNHFDFHLFYVNMT